MQLKPIQSHTHLASSRCSNCGAMGHTARNCPRGKCIGQYNMNLYKPVQDKAGQ
jgi:hypothetical protein